MQVTLIHASNQKCIAGLRIMFCPKKWLSASVFLHCLPVHDLESALGLSVCCWPRGLLYKNIVGFNSVISVKLHLPSQEGVLREFIVVKYSLVISPCSYQVHHEQDVAEGEKAFFVASWFPCPQALNEKQAQRIFCQNERGNSSVIRLA